MKWVEISEITVSPSACFQSVLDAKVARPCRFWSLLLLNLAQGGEKVHNFNVFLDVSSHDPLAGGGLRDAYHLSRNYYGNNSFSISEM